MKKVALAAAAVVRPADLPSVVGFTRMTADRLEKAGLFPKKRRLSPGCVGWLRSELDAWNASRETI